MGMYEKFTPVIVRDEITSSEEIILEGLVALSDSPVGQFIRKEGGIFVNSTLSESLTLSGISDVSISILSSGQVLFYNGLEWINSFLILSVSDIPDLSSVYSVLGHNHAGVYELSGAVATHAALTTGVHGLAITAGQTLTVTSGGTLGSAAYTNSNAYLTSLTGAVLVDQTVGQTIGLTGARVTKLWATEVEATNLISNGGYLAVDLIGIYDNTISSSVGNINLLPVAGSATIIDSHWSFDGLVMTAITDNNTTLTAYTGKNITIEGVTFDGGIVGGISSLGITGARVTTGFFTDLEVTNTIAGSITGNAATATKLAATKTINGVAFDGSANITAPQGFPTAVNAYLSGSDQNINNTTYTKVNLNGEVLDSNSEFDSATNYRFVPAVAGTYAIYGQLWCPPGAGKFMVAAIYKTGANIAEMKTVIDTSDYSGSGVFTICSLAVTDYIELYAYQNSGGALGILAGAKSTYLTVFRIA